MQKYIFIGIALLVALAAGGQDDPGFKTYFKGYQLIINEKWSEAEATFEELIDDFPKSKYVDDSYFWIAYATSEQGDRTKAVMLYEKFIQRFKNSNLVDDAKRNIRTLAQKLKDSGDSTYDKYLNTTTNDSYNADKLREEAVFAIYNSKIDKAEKATRLKQICMNPKQNSKIREKAIFWFGQLRTTNTKDLMDIYETVETRRLKEKVLFALYNTKRQGSAEALAKIFKDETEDVKLREKALFWMAQQKDYMEKNINTLLSYTKANTTLREKLMFNIYNSRMKNRGELLYKIMMDPEETDNVREKALFWMSQDDMVFETKIDEMTKTLRKSPKLFKKLMFNIANSDLSDKRERLLRIAMDETVDQKTRENAIYWLGNQSGSITELKMLYAQVENENLKEKLIYSIGRNGSSEATDFLIKLLKLDNTPVKVKKRILFQLSQIDNDKARKAILELVEE